VPIQADLPVTGEPLWALGAPNAGPARARGEVRQPDVLLQGGGRGMTARLGALMGYSGGPLVDGQGRLRGLVTALLRPGAGPLLAGLIGPDLDGLAHRREQREVFVLSIGTAMIESERIAPNL
jgi:hypothetical protein